ncbi:hypothetical protein FB451DRAFT_1185713 [Mycena latifolia]|nr:hypothetical protein FB451DRAFT_1185713 [Mycena latifolia]
MKCPTISDVAGGPTDPPLVWQQTVLHGITGAATAVQQTPSTGVDSEEEFIEALEGLDLDSDPRDDNTTPSQLLMQCQLDLLQNDLVPHPAWFNLLEVPAAQLIMRMEALLLLDLLVVLATQIIMKSLLMMEGGPAAAQPTGGSRRSAQPAGSAHHSGHPEELDDDGGPTAVQPAARPTGGARRCDADHGATRGQYGWYSRLGFVSGQPDRCLFNWEWSWMRALTSVSNGGYEQEILDLAQSPLKAEWRKRECEPVAEAARVLLQDVGAPPNRGCKTVWRARVPFHGARAVRAVQPNKACKLQSISESLDVNAGETQDSKESQKSVNGIGNPGQCNMASCKGRTMMYNALESISEVWMLRLGRGEPNAVDFGERPNVESRVA